jgi:hypothetical protein
LFCRLFRKSRIHKPQGGFGASFEKRSEGITVPLFEPFSHYLAYGATDQETFRALRDDYDGLLVPGTIAAWQQQGTGGFVLALSATEAAPPYVIDPRFPLFQQGLSNSKQSHLALAELFGDLDLISESDPDPEDFGDTRLAELAQHWIDFNAGYGQAASEKFDKYAQRLGAPVVRREDAQGPEALLAPYFVARNAADRWWERSMQLFEATRSRSSGQCIRVVATDAVDSLASLLDQVPEEQVAIWVSGLDEYRASAADLATYRKTIAAAAAEGKRLFALYGGFFSVLLRSEGLVGCAHGVGFSEHRVWRELPQTGAPPARYYAGRFHRFINQDLAQQLWLQAPDLLNCQCESCDGRPPIALDYHDLMKHSVLCRSAEIAAWQNLANSATASEVIAGEQAAIADAVEHMTLPPAARNRAIESAEHLLRWAAALTG